MSWSWSALVISLTGVGVAGPDCDHPPVWPQLLPDPAGARPGGVPHRSPRLPAGSVRPDQCPG